MTLEGAPAGERSATTVATATREDRGRRDRGGNRDRQPAPSTPPREATEARIRRDTLRRTTRPTEERTAAEDWRRSTRSGWQPPLAWPSWPSPRPWPRTARRVPAGSHGATERPRRLSRRTIRRRAPSTSTALPSAWRTPRSNCRGSVAAAAKRFNRGDRRPQRSRSDRDDRGRAIAMIVTVAAATIVADATRALLAASLPNLALRRRRHSRLRLNAGIDGPALRAHRSARRVSLEVPQGRRNCRQPSRKRCQTPSTVTIIPCAAGYTIPAGWDGGATLPGESLSRHRRPETRQDAPIAATVAARRD